MTKPKIGIIISTTRSSRFGDRPAEWILSLARTRADADYEIVDLRNYPMPLFDSPHSPRMAPIETDGAHLWAAKMAELDGYVFITAEYNRSISAALKNALDHIYYEPAKKPAAFVGYGAVGAARAIEQLRLMSIELGMAPTKNGVHVVMEPFLGLLMEGKSFADYDHLTVAAGEMLNELAWWTRVLKAGRDGDALQQSAAA